jgi:dephospho-CoA kinase
MAKPFVIGLTGSIGMGKSQTAKLFAAEGVPVHDADAATHRLYDKGGAAVAPIAALFPDAVKGGVVDRKTLSGKVAGNAAALARLEAAVHPLVAADRDRFLTEHRDAPIVVLDIPLLLETGAEGAIDALVVVSAPAEVQRARVLSRPGMSVEKFDALLARQLSDAQKRAKAHFVIVTDRGVEHARQQVRMVLETIRDRLNAKHV